MVELTEHKAYQLLNEKYSQCLLDYVIFQGNTETYAGLPSHKEAVIEAFTALNRRERAGNRLHFSVGIHSEAMEAEKQRASEFLKLPKDRAYDSRCESKLTGSRCIEIPSPLPYWYAFLYPPYPVPYTISDFYILNEILFPFPEQMEIYRWNDGFSNYFDDGREWWGTGCWSVYDKVTGIFVIVGASLSD